MLHARWTRVVALAVAGVWLGQTSNAQDKPQKTPVAAAAAAKTSETTKDAKKEPAPPKPRIAVFRLAGTIQETPKEQVFNFGGETAVPLEDLVKRMDKASKDSAVKAVVIVLDQAVIGSAQVEEVRQAIARLKAAGKEVIAHADTIGGLGQYALMSAASRLSVVPTADL